MVALAGAGAAQRSGAIDAAPGPSKDGPAPAAGGAPGQAGRVHLANSGGGFFSFLQDLLGVEPPRRAPVPSYRRHIPGPRRLPPAPEVTPLPPVGPPEAVATYRTMCVRLCDGYYWPVSFATSKDNFGRDEQTCRQSCSGSTALYAYPNPGGEVEEMVSLKGEPYRNLSTAFLYRTVYDPGCKCRPHPWEAAAIERHKSYAAGSQSKPRAVAHGARRR